MCYNCNEGKPLGLRDYVTFDGRYPVREWLDRLDRNERHVVLSYLGRLREGNYGNCENKRGGLYEIKIHKGPGYRVYYTWVRGFIVLLLCGGIKRTQSRDIEQARTYIADHRQRHREGTT